MEWVDPLGLTGHGDNKEPYHSRTIRDELESRYGKENVKSTTVPPLSKPNVTLAGQHKTIELADGSTIRVVFDSEGFRIFDDVARYETHFDIEKFRAKSYDGQLRKWLPEI